MAGGENDSFHIGNLSYDTDTYRLQQAFPSASETRVLTDRETGRSRGFGFVTFPSAEMAKAEMDRLGGPGSTLKIDTRDCKINFATSRGGGAGGGGARRSGYGEYENNSGYPRQSEPRYGGEQHYGEQRSSGGTGGYGGGQSSGRRPDRDYNSSGGHKQQY